VGARPGDEGNGEKDDDGGDGDGGDEEEDGGDGDNGTGDDDDEEEEDEGDGDLSDADAGTLRAIAQSLQIQYTPSESRSVRRAQRHAPSDNESIDDDDVDLTERELRDKQYERLQQSHLEKNGKNPGSRELYAMFDAAKAWAGERKSIVARAKKQKTS
jgi:hypothetical protein